MVGHDTLSGMPDSLAGNMLPAVAAEGFVLGTAEALPAGMRRISQEQFDRSIERLASGRDIDAAVHEARKAMKRLRAVLRLVRGQIGERVYRAENALLRDTARRLAPAREGAVMVGTVRGLRTEFDGQLATDALFEVERRLGDRHAQRRQRLLEDPELVPEVVAVLRAARNRYASWPVDRSDAALDIYGREPLQDSFGAIREGLQRTYARGRRELAAASAQPTADHFHQWRKRVKYLRHQTEILQPVWPEVVGGLAVSLDRLGELLGDEHDLAGLLRLVSDLPALAPDPGERHLLAALAQHRRRRLQAAALTLGSRVYGERPDRFVDRLEGYWDARLREQQGREV